MPFRTLCVLLQSSATRTASPRWSMRNDHRNYRAALRVICLSGRSASSCDAARRELHSHRSVRNDHLNYRATLCVVCLSGRSASSCDAERRELHSHRSVRNDHRNYRAALRVVCLSGRSASSCDAERRELHSHAGALGTISPNIRHGGYLAKEYSPPCSKALRYAGLPCSLSTHAVTFGYGCSIP